MVREADAGLPITQKSQMRCRGGRESGHTMYEGPSSLSRAPKSVVSREVAQRGASNAPPLIMRPSSVVCTFFQAPFSRGPQ